MEALSIRSETMNERYLGLPVFIGRSRSNVFSYLKDRIWQRIQGWKERLLSRAGKEILIKVVAQAIPVFAMGLFRHYQGNVQSNQLHDGSILVE